jgi:hypothetical protein
MNRTRDLAGDVNPYAAPTAYSPLPRWFRWRLIPAAICVLYAGLLLAIVAAYTFRVTSMPYPPGAMASLLVRGNGILLLGVLVAVLAACAWWKRRRQAAIALSLLTLADVLGQNLLFEQFVRPLL